jgi:hypothetical protein
MSAQTESRLRSRERAAASPSAEISLAELF